MIGTIFRFLLPISIFVVPANILLVLPSFASQKSDTSNLYSISKAFSVSILGATTGSGVVVAKDGNRYSVLSAWHVLNSNKPQEEISIVTSDGLSHRTDITAAKRLDQLDLGIITFVSDNNYQLAVTSSELNQVNDTMFVVGFPADQNKLLKITKGSIVGNASINIPLGYSLLYNANTKAGMSGGAILNTNARLIGIHGRGQQDTRATKINKSVAKTGINQGIPIHYFDNPSLTDKSESIHNYDDYMALGLNALDIEGGNLSAIRYFTEATKRSSNKNSLFMLGFSQYDEGLFFEAQQSLEKSLSKPILKGEEYFQIGIAINLANALLRQGKREEARSVYSSILKAIHSDEKFKGVITARQMSILLTNSTTTFKKDPNRSDKSIKTLTWALEHWPENYVALNNRAGNYIDSSQMNKAANDVLLCLSIQPSYAKCHINQARIHMFNDRNELALISIQEAIKKDKYDANSYLWLSRHYADKAMSRLALDSINKAIALDSNTASYFMHRAYIYGDLERRYQQAYGDLIQVIRLDPTHARAYNQKGFILGKLGGDLPQQIKSYSKAISLNPKDPMFFRNRAMTYFHLKNYGLSILDLRKSIDLDPSDPKGYAKLGTVYVFQGNKSEACKSFRLAYDLGDTKAASVLDSRYCGN